MKKPRKVRVIVGLPPWSRRVFEEYNGPGQRAPVTQWRKYVKAARAWGLEARFARRGPADLGFGLPRW